MNKKKQSPAAGANARHRVRDGIREMILNGVFAPGDKLPQIRLAKQFEVSQSVVRESLLELRALGLVEAVDNSGVFVSRLDAEKLVQVYEVREMLEGLSARLCCDRVSRADLRELRGRRAHIRAGKGAIETQAANGTFALPQNDIATNTESRS